MSVSIFFRVDTRPYSAYRDPSLPIAAYIAQGGVAGNASGGEVLMAFRFQGAETDARVSQMYNLEQLSIDTTDGTGRAVRIDTINMDALAPARQASPQMWQTTLVAFPGSLGSGLVLPATQLPIWLGAPAVDPASGDGAIRFTFANVDLILYAITIQGYIWSPRSVLAEGGPQRPVRSLFG